MPLHEGGRGSTDAYDEVEWLLRVERVKVFDKRRLGSLSLDRAVSSEWSVMSSGQGDCRSNSVRTVLAYSFQGLNSRPNE